MLRRSELWPRYRPWQHYCEEWDCPCWMLEKQELRACGCAACEANLDIIANIEERLMYM